MGMIWRRQLLSAYLRFGRLSCSRRACACICTSMLLRLDSKESILATCGPRGEQKSISLSLLVLKRTHCCCQPVFSPASARLNMPLFLFNRSFLHVIRQQSCSPWRLANGWLMTGELMWCEAVWIRFQFMWNQAQLIRGGYLIFLHRSPVLVKTRVNTRDALGHRDYGKLQ